MSKTYVFPDNYPESCPPTDEEGCGTFYRLVINEDKSDPRHFKSHYELYERLDLEPTQACSRRAISMYSEYQDAISLSLNFPKKGKYIAFLNLIGGHGVVCKEAHSSNSHYNWWVPIKVNASDFCLKIEGPVS